MPSVVTHAESHVRNRRAVGLVAMSAVLPGSAQLVAGNRGLGRIVMRTYAAVVGLVLLLGLGLLVWRGPTVGLLLHPSVTPTVRVVLWVLFVAWALLLADAWRLANPPRLARGNRLLLTVSCVSLAIAVGLGMGVVASALTAVNNVSQVFVGGGDEEVKAGRYNILLLGVDAAEGRDGIRPDSINVASVDAATGRTVVFGLPRNLQGAPFPPGSPLRELYPDGYRCPDDACMLNGVHTLAEEHADLYPGQDAGLAAMREVVGESLGLEINYYAMVDMAGFQSLINAMGGIRLDINKRIPMGGGGSAVHGYIEPGLDVQLDGYHALWFARSRHGSSDYERMVRQKCVMSAMARQLDPGVVATRFVELSEAGKNILRTDVGGGHLAELGELALKAKDLDIVSMNFVPPLIVSADPDFQLIRSTVADAIAASQALDDPSPAPVTAESSDQAPATQPSEEETGVPAIDDPTTPAADVTADGSTAPTAEAGPTTEAGPSTETEATTETEADWICRIP